MPPTQTKNKGEVNSSYCASEKRVSQWEELMRKFSRAHEEECKTVKLDIPRAYRSTKYFPTGSKYEGTWDVLGMSGFGTYTFPNGVVYAGDFEDGMFHGNGELIYPDGTTVKGHFYKGVMLDRKLTFADGLEYEEFSWQYCKIPDRRYTIEYDYGLEPAGQSNITAEQPPREIPPGFYDTGDGFYNPRTKSVYRADDLNIIIRSPSVREQKWIIENCRTNPDVILGPRRDLYETWSEPQVVKPPVKKPAACTRAHPTARKRSVYDTDFNVSDFKFIFDTKESSGSSSSTLD
ncbi:MORN repeat-containing protein 5-like isoform X2 [Anticarsia gemmatalis]|uniref:MORN repeat-containing protein 5-like isoform X2 n=1 Tax=Anticarsia gemmatalis TaxID=129554 RepID=UPI003F777A41